MTKKQTLVTTASVALVLLLLAAPYAPAQDGTQQPSVFEGQLLGIDPDMQTIVVGAADGDQTMMFTYTEDTAVTGSLDDVQGLDGKAGAQLRVTYDAHGDANIATAIEVVNLPEQEL